MSVCVHIIDTSDEVEGGAGDGAGEDGKTVSRETVVQEQ